MATFMDQVVSNQLNSGDPAASSTGVGGGSASSLLNLSSLRLGAAGLFSGAVPGLAKSIPNIGTQSLNQAGGATAPIT